MAYYIRERKAFNVTLCGESRQWGIKIKVLFKLM